MSGRGRPAERQREVLRLISEAEKLDWKVIERKRGFQLLSPDGETVLHVHKTPQDWRAFKNLKAQIKRYTPKPEEES